MYLKPIDLLKVSIPYTIEIYFCNCAFQCKNSSIFPAYVANGMDF